MLKLLLLVLGVGAVAGRCPQGNFLSKVLSECVPCSKCTHSYLLRACTLERDTVCADEIHLTLDWLHPSKANHHLSKDRLSAIEQDLYTTSEDLPKPLDKKKPKHFHFPDEITEKPKHNKKHKKHYEFDDIDDKDYDEKDFGPEDKDYRKKDYGLELKEFRKKNFGLEEKEFRKKDFGLKDKEHRKKDFGFEDIKEKDFDLDDEDYREKDFGHKDKEYKKKEIGLEEKGYRKKDFGLEEKEFRKKDFGLEDKWGHKKKWSVNDEKTLEEWLRDSRDRLKHRKQDLLRTLKHSSTDSKDSPARRLNQPNRNALSDIINGLVKHELHRDGVSELMQELEMADKAHQIKESSEEEDREEEEDQAQRLIHLLSSHESPHRLFLGQPSTVSEIIGQVKEDGAYKSNVVLEKSTLHAEPDGLNPLHVGESVVAEPFSATEALVWDWQAVALVSAVAACLLFFVIAAIYLLLSARDTKRISSDHDGEEMTTMVALMPPSDDQEQSQYKPRPIVIAKPGHGLGYVHNKSYARS